MTTAAALPHPADVSASGHASKKETREWYVAKRAYYDLPTRDATLNAFIRLAYHHADSLIDLMPPLAERDVVVRFGESYYTNAQCDPDPDLDGRELLALVWKQAKRYSMNCPSAVEKLREANLLSDFPAEERAVLFVTMWLDRTHTLDGEFVPEHMARNYDKLWPALAIIAHELPQPLAADLADVQSSIRNYERKTE